MNEINYIQSFLEYCSGSNKIPSVLELKDVLKNVGTPFPRSISERTVDAAIDAIKDLRHSEISISNNYTNEDRREADKNFISAMAEMARICTKDFLRTRGLIGFNE